VNSSIIIQQHINTVIQVLSIKFSRLNNFAYLVEEDLLLGFLVVFSLAVALELTFSLQGYMRVAFSIFHSFFSLSFIQNEEDARRRGES